MEKQTATSLLGLEDKFTKVLQYGNGSFLNEEWLAKLEKLVTRLTRAPPGVKRLIEHIPFPIVRKSVSTFN